MNTPPYIPLMVCLVVTVEFVGLLSAWLARASEDSPNQALAQMVFLGCLAAVGATTVVSLGLHPGCWLSSAATLSLMVLAVTCDFERTDRIHG